MELIEEIFEELERATNKFPLWPTDPLHAQSILDEEVGEVKKEILQVIYEPHKSTKKDVREEAIQVAAMSIRFLLSLDKYEYKESEQHAQDVFKLK